MPAGLGQADRIIDTRVETAIERNHPVLERGVGHRHERWDGRRWTRAALKTRARTCGRRSRVVLTPRRWRQVGGGNFASDGVNKPITGESTRQAVNHCAGNAGCFRCDLTNACAFYHCHCTRGCGRIGRPAFPAPSDWRGRNEQAKTRAKRAARSRTYISTSLRGAQATKQSILCAVRWIASLALAMTVLIPAV